MLQAIALGKRGDLTGSESVVWSLRRGVPYVPCPMLWGEEIYLLEDQSFFSCLGATDGARRYLKHRLPGNLNFSASPVGAADRIYLLSEAGRMVVLKRGPEIKVLAINKLNETFYASPAIVGDARLNGEVVQAAPEYESCREVAAQAGVPLKEVYAAAQKALEY